MKKIILMLLICWMHGVVVGQEKDTVKTIEWNYRTKKFKNDEVFRKLKISDIVQLQIMNLPSNYTISSNITFLNNHLELRGSFGNNIAFGKNNPYYDTKENTSTNTADSLKKEIQNKEKGFTNELKSKNKITDTIGILNQKKTINKSKIEELNTLKNKLLRINYKNLEESLEIGIAENYIKRNKENEKALEDIKWQKYLIKNASLNWENQIKIRDEIIVRLSNNIDSLTTSIASKDSIIEKLKPVTTYYFSPVKIENYDFTEFNITITDKTDNSKPTETEFNFPFKNKGGFKLDFSTGILATGLYSPTYKFYSNDTSVQIKEEASPKSKFNTGIALMAHAYSRTGSYVNIGVGSGFSYNLNSQNLNYLLGGSLLWGEEQRFITTLGLNIGKVKELSNYYEINKDYDATEFTVNAAVPTVDVLKASWFISITYNLGINNSSKTKKL